MGGSWTKGPLILVAAGVIVLGVGIWRKSTGSGSAAPRTNVAVGAATSGTAPATGAATTSPGTSGASSTGAATASKLPGGDKLSGPEKELEALLRGFQEKAKTATDKRALAEEHATALQAFLARYPNEKIADYVRIRLGQLQMSLGRGGDAVNLLRGVVERPQSPELKPLAQVYLAQAQATTGDMAGAKETLRQVVQTNGKTQVQTAAKQLLAQLEARDAVTLGKAPPAFEAKDLTGAPQSLDRYRGKVVLIDFWATWCGPCIGEMPNVKAIYEKYKHRGFTVLGISLDKEKRALEAFVKERGLSWPQIFDGKGWKNSIAQTYGVSSIPKMILLDRQGIIRFVDARGAALEAAVAQLVDQPAS
jgi:peroxiredoxin/TolA-binding protein